MFFKRTFSILKTIFKTVFFTVIAVFSVAFIINISVIASSLPSTASHPDSNASYECIAVLGCSVLPDGKTPSNALKQRLDKAIELYKSGAAPKILMTGDSVGPYYYETNVMKAYAVKNGVPENDIIIDPYGVSAYDSMARLKNEFDFKSVLVVTQKYHLYRSVYIARSFGINAYGVWCDENAPNFSLKRDIREFGARIKDFAYCIIQPDTVYTSNP